MVLAMISSLKNRRTFLNQEIGRRWTRRETFSSTGTSEYLKSAVLALRRTHQIISARKIRLTLLCSHEHDK